jgi:sulfite dehydrogenase
MRSRSSSPERHRLGSSSLAVVAAGLAIVATAPLSATAADDPQMAEGRALFTGGAMPPCAICHTLKDAGATGAVGPVLDDLRPDEARVAAAVRGGIGAMPSFAGSLSDAQIRALAHYVAKASGGSP